MRGYTDLYAADPELNAIALPRAAQNQKSTFFARLQLIRELRKQKFDAIVNLHGGPTSAQLTFLSGARHRAGAQHFRQSYAYNLRIPAAEEVLQRNDLHTVEYQFGQFRWLGLPADEPAATQLYVDATARTRTHAKLQAASINPQQPYALLAPTNEFYTKRWLPERFAAIAEKLNQRGYQIVMTGAPTDEQRAQLAAVQAATKLPLAALSNLSIGELVAAIADAQLFVGNDSGPAHIASAVRTPQVVLFGPASSQRWRPWRAPAVMVQNDFACNPCAMYKYYPNEPQTLEIIVSVSE